MIADRKAIVIVPEAIYTEWDNNYTSCLVSNRSILKENTIAGVLEKYDWMKNKYNDTVKDFE